MPPAKRPPDPDALGRIRNIVTSAHKWGGNGRKPLFRKIRRVLVSRHPEVIAKAFGGQPNVAAAWIKNNWYRIRGQEPPPTRKKRALADDVANIITEEMIAMRLSNDFIEIPDEAVDTLITKQGVTHELFFDHSDPGAESEGLIYKDVLRTGVWKEAPSGSGPLSISLSMMQQMVEAFNEGAWNHVTVPMSHEDRLDENTGFVRRLFIKPDPARDGEHVLRAGIEFTDMDIRDKVLAGSIANTSVGVDFGGVKRNSDGRQFPAVLKHIALTNAPWINGLAPFGTPDQLAASNMKWTISFEMDEPEAPDNVIPDEIADTEPTTPEDEMDDAQDDPELSVHRADWLPDGLTQTDLSDTDFAWISDAYRHGQQNKSEGRMIPYKVRGQVVAAGWQNAWDTLTSLADETLLAGGPTLESVLDRLLKDKPEEIALTNIDKIPTTLISKYNLNIHDDEEDDEEKKRKKREEEEAMGLSDESLHRDKPETNPEKVPNNTRQENLSESTGTEGGDSNMADENNTPDEQTLSLSQDELNSQINSAVDDALTKERESAQEREEAMRLELSKVRRENHARAVKEKLAEYEEAGHAPAVLKAVEPILLADEEHREMLTLSQDEGEDKTVSATALVDQILLSIPGTAPVNPKVAPKTDAPDDTKSFGERVDEEYNALYPKG